MKILHILYAARAEGTVKLTLDWLAEPGHCQEVMVLCSHPAELQDALQGRASHFVPGSRVPGGAWKWPWILVRVRRACLARKPDLVICWCNGFSPWVLAGARLGGVRRLITHAGNPPTWTRQGKFQTALSTFTAWAAGGRMVCCSAYVAREFARSPCAFASVLRVVPNCALVAGIRQASAAARAARSGEAAAARRFIMVATLEAHKDHDTLIRAMPLVRRQVPGAGLWVVGDGSLRPRLERLSEGLGLGGIVTFLGSRPDVPALLGESDVFVFSTTPAEGLGTVLIEAMAAGLPIVASDVPACREVLEDGKWGALVRPADPAALAQALVACAGTCAAGADPGPSGGSWGGHLERYRPARMIEAYIAAVS